MKTLKLLLLGFGNAAQAFADLLIDKETEIADQFGYEVSVVGIVTKSRGCLVNQQGIDLKKALGDVWTKGKFDNGQKGFTQITSMEAAKGLEYDVLVELTALDIFTGQPAIDHIKTAFSRGKHVITANKGPVAWAFRELKEMAQEQGSLFFYETTVMDGTPVFNLVRETLKLCRVTEVEGILNSTTNFILEELAKGKEYDSVIAEGKCRGFIEADPSIDIDGWDAAAKVAALLNVLMDAGITPGEIDRTGIGGITKEQIREAHELYLASLIGIVGQHPHISIISGNKVLDDDAVVVTGFINGIQYFFQFFPSFRFKNLFLPGEGMLPVFNTV
jgi:homoserine dehydrogenase